MNTDDSMSVKKLMASMRAVICENGKYRLNGEVNAIRTSRFDMEVMDNFARTLHGAGFKLEEVDNLGEKHIAVVFDQWVKVRGLSNKTLQGQKSRVKMFCRWLKKPGLVRFVSEIDSRYADTHAKGFSVSTVAKESKSWRAMGVDVEALFKEAMLQDQRHAAMLMLGRAFGLRKKEMLLIKLWKSDKGDRLSIIENVAKNGRPRDVAIESGEFGGMQRRVLDYAKSKCNRSESLAWPELTLAQAERRYFHYNERLGLTKAHFGVTGHGLRAGYAEDLMLLRGILPPTLGGTKEMSNEMHRVSAKFNASKALGHNRMDITHAYYGSDKRHAKAGEILGYEFAEPMVLSQQEKAVLWVSEKPVAVEGAPEQYALSGVSAELAYITVQIMSGQNEVSRLSVGQFIEQHPIALDAVNVRVGKLGFFIQS